ncbi:MAG TPA: glycosyl transferase [Usitatibacter sp.]|nr:glycosyl transferase [Usitatibacter sp.]
MASGLHIFTSAAANYLPKVRTLCHSLRRHHPEATVHVALADERPEGLRLEGEPFDSVIALGELGIPDWRPWAFQHDIVELSTAIKPFVLKRLLALPGCTKALYFDPDMVLFSRVDDILSLLDGANIALTPHQNKPERTLDAIVDNEIGSLKWGIFNLGFLGVANTAETHRFVDWWSQRTYHFCWADVPNGLFTDQKWINHVPVFFDAVSIVKSSRHNVATWNLTTRRMTGDLEAGFVVDGEPLGFYHFTGFDSGAHSIMAVKNAAGNASVQRLIDWYEKETTPRADDPRASPAWAYGHFSNGAKIDAAHRTLYRFRRDLQQAFPDPFDASPGKLTFFEWCETTGRARHPELFKGDAATAAAAARALPRFGISPRVGLSLLGTMFMPRRGRGLRSRLAAVLRSEGIGGVTRRLWGSRG